MKNKRTEKQSGLASIWHWFVMAAHEFPLPGLFKLSLCIKKGKKSWRSNCHFVIPDLLQETSATNPLHKAPRFLEMQAWLISLVAKIMPRSHVASPALQRMPVSPGCWGGMCVWGSTQSSSYFNGLPKNICSRHLKNRKKKRTSLL